MTNELWNTPATSPAWRTAYRVLWLSGGGLAVAYAGSIAAGRVAEGDWLELAARVAVVALFILALAKGRQRFARYPTLKYFCITATTTLFLLAMVASAFEWIPLERYTAIVIAYLAVMAFLATRRGEAARNG